MSSKKLAKRKGLLAKVNTSCGLQYRMGNVEQNIYNTKTELEFEIECARCYDKMTLCSDFDGLYYFCEECGFLLHA
ncbi:MAG TPA: hypothetical protein VEH06_00825 [Candidatus Bathyarchaeia archaeon]|nr:hypothetical protein [Candidatus Bathyarchaeia archaeon]